MMLAARWWGCARRLAILAASTITLGLSRRFLLALGFRQPEGNDKGTVSDEQGRKPATTTREQARRINYLALGEVATGSRFDPVVSGLGGSPLLPVHGLFSNPGRAPRRVP